MHEGKLIERSKKGLLYSKLLIKDLTIPLKLGVTAKEREVSQEIFVGVEIRFFQPPAAVKSDQIENTVCYSNICNRIKIFLHNREFNLIEKVAGDLYLLIREIIGNENHLRVKVHKITLPIEGLRGGTQFSMGDFEDESEQ